MLAEAGLDSVNRVLKLKPGRTAAFSQSSDIFPLHLTLTDGRQWDIFVKRYRYRSVVARLGGVLRGTLFGRHRAAFEYAFLAEMRRRELPAVRPLAYAARRSFGFVKAAVLITEAAPHPAQLDTWVAKNNVPGDLVRTLGREVRRLHEAGVQHGGLFLRNILLDTESKDSWRFFYIDPDRSGRLVNGPLPRDRAAEDLSDLAASALVVSRATDHMRFIHAYFDVRRLGPDQKSTVAGVLRRARTKVKQEGHRIAVGGMIHWLQVRMEGTQGSSHPIFGGVEHFASVANGASIPMDGVSTRHAVVVLSDADAPTTNRFRLSVDAGQVRTERTTEETGDLTISADEATWLAVLNAEPTAFQLIRQGRMTMTGETRYLTVLARLVDEIIKTGRVS